MIYSKTQIRDFQISCSWIQVTIQKWDKKTTENATQTYNSNFFTWNFIQTNPLYTLTLSFIWHLLFQNFKFQTISKIKAEKLFVCYFFHCYTRSKTSEYCIRKLLYELANRKKIRRPLHLIFCWFFVCSFTFSQR